MPEVTFERQHEVLHGEFSIDTHKQTFVNYLEVCIDTVGRVHYAVPSHTEWLVRRYTDIFLCTREQAMNDVPPESYGDVAEWFCSATYCIAVWNDHYIGKPNIYQLDALRKLKEAGLYSGEVW